MASLTIAGSAQAETVKVTMDRTSPFMTLCHKATGEAVSTGVPEGMTYTFEAAPGSYVMTAYAKDTTTVTGTIVLNVLSADEEFIINTCTIGALNAGWVIDEDYTVSVDVTTREGQAVEQTLGHSTTAGRRTFLAFNGNSFHAAFIPNEAHQQEGYMTRYKQGTLTGGINVLETITMGYDYTVTLPADAHFFMGIKTTHYVPFTEVMPDKTDTEGDLQTLTFRLAANQAYNFRTWKEGKLTQGGYFTMKADEAHRPQLAFTEADYEAFDPHAVKHDVTWNGGYETGDILLNINERGHLQLGVGQTFDALAMRSWQLTDTQTNNYFLEPDFHYTVVGLDGQPSEGVIEIDDDTTGPWTTIRAVGQGTAIVLVTYDAIGLNYYENGKTERKPYMGGQYWSAIWPENTAVYVVSVGDEMTAMEPNMTINEAYNEGMKKLAGKYVDAEHDVFYYLDTDEGYPYTFTPTGVATVQMARPQIGERMATYNGFSDEGVTRHADGSYTLLLKEGRQIVRLSDAQGNAVYQVLTAKRCHRDIVNTSRPDSHIFQPGDKVKIQYSGLRHPANKLAGIYNMSAYVTYNGTPNGTSLILSPNQYTFGSAVSAQTVTIDIPADYDLSQNTEIVLSDGVIQVNGYGDPVGNHRNTTRQAGRSPNFTAVAHKTYFGALPDVCINLQPVRTFTVRIESNVEGAVYSFAPEVTDNGDGTYSATYGTYNVTASKAGYRCYRGEFTIADDAEGEQVVHVEMLPVDIAAAWDGMTATEPIKDDNNVYQIGTGAELAWFAMHVNNEQDYTAKAVLTADIDLGDYDWTPIGGQNKTAGYRGQFDGQGHIVSGLYIDQPAATHQALFGIICGRSKFYDEEGNVAMVSRLTVEGRVSARQYVGGVVAFQGLDCIVDRCVNRADITANYAHAGGVVAFQEEYSAACTNSYNEGTVTAPTNAGGVVGSNFIASTVTNVFSTGEVVCPRVAGACVGGGYTKKNVTNAFATREYSVTEGNTLVSDEQMQGGHVAWMLGEAFGQQLGTDAHPVLDGPKVFKVVYTTNLTADIDSLYTNGQLPVLPDVDGMTPTWFSSPDGEPVGEVNSDTTLYVSYAKPTAIASAAQAEPSDGTAIYNLQGWRQNHPVKGYVYLRRGKKIIAR